MRKRTLPTAFLLLGILLAGGVLLEGQAPAPQQPAAPAPDPQAVVARRVEIFLRYLFAWGPEMQVSVTPPRPSVIPGLYSAIVRVTEGERRSEEVVLVSADGRYIVRGDLFDVTRDPFAEARRGIVTAGQPSQGPADAPITIVEYGDFQCPTCAQVHLILKRLLAERNDVRLVFKDLPLTHIHDWALRGAVAARCAFQQSPQAFWTLHDYFFENQRQLNQDNLDSRLDAFAARIGLNLAAFRACRVQETTRPQVEQSLREAAALDLVNTPTLFINGRPLVGAQSYDTIHQFVAYEAFLHEQGTRLPAPKP